MSIPYQLTRSKRKTIGLYINKGELDVRAPLQVSVKEIEEFIHSKQDWINRHLKAQQQQLDMYPEKQMVDEQQFHYLGSPLSLKIEEGTSGLSWLSGHELKVTVPRRVKDSNKPSYIKKQIRQWYESKAQRHYNERCDHWADQIGVMHKQVVVKNYASKWGCCYADRTVAFNWRLMMAPDFVIDYVVVHELCHIKHMNHSQRFWRLVYKHFERTPEAKAWLKSHFLMLEL